MYLALIVVVEWKGATLGWDGLGKVGTAAGGSERHYGLEGGMEGLMQQEKDEKVAKGFQKGERRGEEDGMWC